MSRLFRRRLQRALDNVPAPPPDLSSLSPDAQLLWALNQVGLLALLQGPANDRKPAEPATVATPEPCEREPQVKVTPSTSPVDNGPPAKPRPRKSWWEPDPSSVPPQNQYWEERCKWRVRGLHEPYDEEPPEQDELDELIYGSSER